MGVERIDFKARLNPEQYAAACHIGGPLQILAGAGSGKTRVLTHRIAHLVLEGGVSPESIVAVTFTNRAATEMAERVHELLSEVGLELTKRTKPWLGTFHRTCARLLRIHGSRININPRFVIYDDGDQRTALKRAVDSFEIDITPKFVSQCSYAIDAFKNRGVDPCWPWKRRWAGKRSRWRRSTPPTSASCARRARWTLGISSSRPSLLLRKDDEVRALLHRRWRYIMVDEFQDTNEVQYELLRHLTDPKTRNLAVVGDDDQSIYGWRGATVRNILDFSRDYPDAKVVKLEQNYRSSQNILDAAGAVIEKLTERTDKKLWTEAGKGEQIKIFTGTSDREEASWVAREINRLMARGLVEARQCAVFYRTNAQARLFEEQFRAAGLGYNLVGGTSFYQRAEVKDLLAYLKVALNPNDTIGLLRILNTPRRNLGPKTLLRLESLISLELGPNTLYEAIGFALEKKMLPNRRHENLTAFHQLLEDLKERTASGERPSVLTQELIEKIGYLPHLEKVHPQDADERREHILDLIGAMQDFEHEYPGLGVQEFLERALLETSADREGGDNTAMVSPPITMMTVHASKGLEFDVVFSVGMEDGLFPMIRPHKREEADIDEERRLCYVSMTRARRLLYLTNARRRRPLGAPESRDTRPSRFLADIPPDLMRISIDSAEQTVVWRETHAAGALDRAGIGDSFHFDQRPELPVKKKRKKQKAQKIPVRRAMKPMRDPFDQSPPDLDEHIEPPPVDLDISEPEDPLIGRIVSHPRNGIGEVVGVSGFGDRATLTVKFASSGQEVKIIRRFVKLY